jgi:hypothetical protein
MSGIRSPRKNPGEIRILGRIATGKVNLKNGDAETWAHLDLYFQLQELVQKTPVAL